MAIQKITQENFAGAVAAADHPILVEFWAPWCVYCRRLSAVVDKLAGEGKVAVGQVNIDEQPSLAAQFSIDTIPTFLLFRDGNPGPALIAPDSKAAIEAWLSEQGV